MKIITCASFYGSGSSALTDLVAEYQNVKDLTNYEFRFLYDLDGITDLEYHLCDCHDRHNSGHALKRFERLSRFNAGTSFNPRYEPFFDNKYAKLTKIYIDRLIDFVYPGWWFYDVYDKGNMYYPYMLLNKVLRKISRGEKGILSNEKIICSHPTKDQFLEYTQDYVASLLRAANKENKEYLEIDQLVPSQNVGKVLRYFKDDIYVFIIDRDPRDIYISNRFYWKEHICPSDDVNTFCDWFLYTRESGENEVLDDKKVFRLRFEDLIYKYDDTVKFIESITGLKSENHINRFKKLNPLRSVNNTQIWKKHDVASDIEIIEKRLAKYLYPFEIMEDNEIRGIKSSSNDVF